MSVTCEECSFLIEEIFREECHAMIKSKENSPYFALLQKGDSALLKRNFDGIAKHAARYYMQKHGSNLEDETLLRTAFNSSIGAALRAFRR